MTAVDDMKKVFAYLKTLPSPPTPDSVEECDGVAVFKRNGNVVGWMNWRDFEAICEEREALKPDPTPTVQKDKP